MTGPGTEGCLTPSLCLFTRLATNGCVALNKTRARWPRSRAGSLYPGIDFPHTRSCSRFPSAIVTGLCGAPQATGCQRLPAAAQCIARRNTMGRLKLEVPRGRERPRTQQFRRAPCRRPRPDGGPGSSPPSSRSLRLKHTSSAASRIRPRETTWEAPEQCNV